MKVEKKHKKGNHLIMDGTSKADLNNKKNMKKLLLDLVKIAEMKPISKPLIIKYNAKDREESGVTGTIILAESNITIHTYPEKNLFFLDLFSCKEFEIDKITDYLKKELKMEKHKIKILKRGDY
jgi:S-adenosylmethionine decarboxylase